MILFFCLICLSNKYTFVKFYYHFANCKPYVAGVNMESVQKKKKVDAVVLLIAF